MRGWPQASPAPSSALFFDLDRLKAINDYLGHTAGDWFIRVLAERLRRGAEGPNLIARLGGDEFVVVPADPMDADAAEDPRLPAAVDAARTGRHRRRDAHTDGQYRCGARGFRDRHHTSDLLRRADQAVLAAKNAGGNQVAVFTDDMSLKSEFRNDIELHLQSVIENGALLLHYLPEVDMRTGEILAAKRWSAGSTRPAACSPPICSSASPNRSTWPASWGAG